MHGKAWPHPGAGYGPELAPNGSFADPFEFSPGVWIPLHWFLNLNGGLITQLAGGLTGPGCMRLHLSVGQSDMHCEPCLVAGDMAYRLQGYVKGTGSSDAVLCVRWFSDTGATDWISEEWLRLPGPYADWQEVNANVQSPLAALSADVVVKSVAEATCDLYVDDISLRRRP